MLIETFADLTCPWCYIGRHRLLRALAERPRVRPDVRWQPFQLNPDLPRGGMERDAYMVAKFGGPERARQIHAVIEDTADRDGLDLHLGRIKRMPSTFDAHRLIRMAGRRGVSGAMVDALFHAYFVDGLDIGDIDTLAATAGRVGLDATEIKAQLLGDAEVSNVRSADALARQLTLQAVPCFVFNRRYALSGAQEPGSFLPLLDLSVDEDAEMATAVTS